MTRWSHWEIAAHVDPRKVVEVLDFMNEKKKN
jgi:hypothetical protein